jgi:hypothetical protein
MSTSSTGPTGRDSRRDRWATDDILAEDAERRHPTVEVHHGMVLTHTASGTTGRVAGFSEYDRVILVDRYGTKQSFAALDGAFVHDGVRVALRAGHRSQDTAPRRTASGSVADPQRRARVANPSRIWVEGLHDADLIQKVWGEDLGGVGIAVEALHGADDLAANVRAFGPGPGRRLGILLDHLVKGSKEWRIASEIDDPNVLICGHPYVDIWEAVSPAAVGIERWPDIPMGEPWKAGVLERLGVGDQPGAFWARVLASVSSWHDVETPLVTAVEQLIDFASEPHVA